MVDRTRRRSIQSVSLAAFLLLSLYASIAVATQDGPSDDASISTAALPVSTNEEIKGLIEELGHEDWTVREFAAVKLERYGPAIYDLLREAFRTTDRVEIRNRLKRVVYEIHLNQTVGPVRAFLGISHYPADVTFEADPRLTPGATGLLFTDIVPGSAAALVGLRKGDVLVGLNGRRGTMTESAASFVSWIAGQIPGTTCVVTIFRGGAGRTLNRESVAGFDVRAFQRTSSRLVTWETDRRLPDGAVGLELTEVERADKRLDLRAGDMIVAINGRRLVPETAQLDFERLIHEQAVSDPDEDENDPNRQPQVQLVPLLNRGIIVNNNASNIKPSVQIVRGGEVRDFEVTLLARPASLRGGRAFQRNASARAISDADDSFIQLWQDTFAMPGLASDRIDSGAVWRLESK